MFILFVHLISSKIYIGLTEERQFLNWMRTNNHFYTGSEYHLRLGIYLANSRFVQQHNKGGYHYKVCLNKFSAYTPSEYRSLLREFSTIIPSTTKRQNKKIWTAAPTELDWRSKGAVNEVVDQGGCGSCWAFGSIAGAEGCWFLSKGELFKYSEQNLVDCVTTCQGCGGGLRDAAYAYVIEYQNGQFNFLNEYAK